jgi:hypothetical protein
MRTIVITSLLALAASSVQAKGSCTSQNPGLEWTVNPLYVDGSVAAIQGDGAPFINGQDGVNTVINVCSGTYDATLVFSGSARSLSFDFSGMVAHNQYTPSWALAGNTESGPGGFFNVHDLWFVPVGYTRADEYTFTTWFGSNVPARGTPGFRMTNPSHDAPPGNENPTASNVPYPNARVIAHHCPANTNTASCPNVVAETWFVYPEPVSTTPGDPAPVGVLLTTVKGSLVNSGEFRMPFFFTISMLN